MIIYSHICCIEYGDREEKGGWAYLFLKSLAACKTPREILKDETAFALPVAEGNFGLYLLAECTDEETGVCFSHAFIDAEMTPWRVHGPRRSSHRARAV